MFVCKLLVLSALCLSVVWGHGMVMDPINRSSRWRVDPKAPHNYEDDENYCGSFGTHWIINKGKCGICGDDYRSPRPRENENGGRFGQGVIVKQYKSGSLITVDTVLTANHWGWFQYSVCSLDGPTHQEEEENFHILKLADGTDKYNLTTSRTGSFKIQLRLPPGLTCKHCCFRWHYRTANSWGNCEDGSEGMGCGPQEWFRSCSDISIV